MENLINGLKTNRSFAVSSLLVLALLALAAAAPVLSPYDPAEATMQNAYLEPSAEHIFGTDKLGRDVFSRILYGARYSLSGVLLLVAVIFSGWHIFGNYFRVLWRQSGYGYYAHLGYDDFFSWYDPGDCYCGYPGRQSC